MLRKLKKVITMSDKDTPKPCPFCGAVAKEKDIFWQINHKQDCYISERLNCCRTLFDKAFPRRISQWNNRPVEKAAYILGRKEQAARGKQRIG